jgi:diguanylate cyclase (GGDEF)-like protein/PAS domain S-box-containing protein
MKFRVALPGGARYELAARLAGSFVVVTLATLLVGLSSHGPSSSGGFLFWPANGTLLAYLLLTPRWRWGMYLCVGLAAMVTGNALLAGHFYWGLLIPHLLNVCEVLLAALLLRRRSFVLPRFTEIGYLVQFVGLAVLAAPIVVGAVYALLQILTHQDGARSSFFHWALADGLGTAVTTPALVAILRSRFREKVDWSKNWIYLVSLAAVTIAAFSQATLPLLFLVYPFLVLALLRVGLAWSTLALLFVAVTAGGLTLRGWGPFAALARLGAGDPSVLLSLFVAAGMFILYSVSVVIERQKATERKLEEIATLHNLVSDNSRDVIAFSGFDGRRRFVSAAAETMGGWKREQVMQQNQFELVHPDDRQRAITGVRELINGGEEARLELRLRKITGEYIWAECLVRTVNDPKTGAPLGLLNIIRDISGRKHAEQQLQDAYRAVEALAETDALTRLANRRRFDHVLTTEWRRSMRDHTQLSLLMIDADYFKSYNDTFGHTRGDGALKQIAEAAQDVVNRPGDLVARFGGEEFAVILPNTDNEGAMRVAGDICQGLFNRRLRHGASPAGVLTLSVGCGTMVAGFGQHSVNLIELADQALYTAKRSGRNQVCNGNTLLGVEAVCAPPAMAEKTDASEETKA